jgi:uncharacterized protein YdiU (UPF0061 family)
MRLHIDNRFNSELPADPNEHNTRRQVMGAAFSFVRPRLPGKPQLLHASGDVAELIGLLVDDVRSDEFLRVFSGAEVLDGNRPYAMCYGGHQFGSWAGQLGDGRAINLAEVKHDDRHWMLQLKGAGETPYSRTADGLAVLRSSLREHLCSEAMHFLGVPTSRSLCLITTGDHVMRDVMYDGNPELEPGAVVCRVAPSFIRFGSFEIFASRNDLDSLRKLADHTIRHHFPGIESGSGAGYGDFFRVVCERTLDMILHWQRVGFVHGVMNTDNMSIHGDTIDYGPYGWLEGYDPDWTPNTTDAGRGRYRYGNQPSIALWNLVRLANSLYPLVESEEPFEAALEEYQSEFERRSTEMRAAKIGLDEVKEGDVSLLDELDEVLRLTETDMTIFFRLLADVTQSHETTDDERFLLPVMDAFYSLDELKGETLNRWRDWFDSYLRRLDDNTSSDGQRREKMNAINPRFVLRNYMAQLAIDKATDGDPSLIDELHQLLTRPYDEQPENDKWFAKRPDWARHKVGCSMLSCSS